MNMDVSSLQQFGINGIRSVPEQAVSELNHEVDSGVKCNERVLQARNAGMHKNMENLNQNANETLGTSLEDSTINSSKNLPAEVSIRDSSSPKRAMSENTHESVIGSQKSKILQTEAIGSETFQTASEEIRLAEQIGLSLQEAKRESSLLDQMRTTPADFIMGTTTGQLELPPQGATKNLFCQDEAKSSNQARPGKKGVLMKRKMPSGSPRILRSRSQEKFKTPEPNAAPTQDAGSREKKRKKKKKKQMKKMPDNEFSRIRTHLRYLVTRMNYEQNLIDAYSGEGWKGQSLEKIKPEKELQRAKSEILRLKLKIRDLFQRIDKSCTEGRLPESLFDSEGLIDSEDIFCAKCGQKDVRVDNDIILCDGTCERGFHQFCLQPPLLKEQVPPGDEGWLCPACDCKVDCTDLLNDSQGTSLSINDSWEKIFPEAAVAGNKPNDDLGLSSDDSEDDDYDPDGPELDQNVEGEDSSSDDSDSSFASEDLTAVANDEQYLGLPSEDSEDDDYDPDKVVSDEQVKQESSSSDFTSDSEDINALLKDEGAMAEVQGPFMPENIENVGASKRLSISDELLTLSDSDLGNDHSTPISGKRHVERLDYKKLYDETYGCNTSSDSSDEDFTGTNAPKRRKNDTGGAASVPSFRKAPVRKHRTDAEGMDMKNSNQTQSEHTPKENLNNLDDEGTSSSPANSNMGAFARSSGDRGATKSTSRRLGENVTQRLYEFFKENQYPDRDAKENLAKELTITAHQVSKWFENARWSFRHSDKGVQVAKSLPKTGTSVGAKEATSNGVKVKDLPEVCAKRNTDSPRTPKPRNKKVKADCDTDTNSTAKEMPNQNVLLVDSPKVHSFRRSGRIQSKHEGKEVS